MCTKPAEVALIKSGKGHALYKSYWICAVTKSGLCDRILSPYIIVYQLLTDFLLSVHLLPLLPHGRGHSTPHVPTIVLVNLYMYACM